jgi:hypothetical protein
MFSDNAASLMIEAPDNPATWLIGMAAARQSGDPSARRGG